MYCDYLEYSDSGHRGTGGNAAVAIACVLERFPCESVPCECTSCGGRGWAGSVKELVALINGDPLLPLIRLFRLPPAPLSAACRSAVYSPLNPLRPAASQDGAFLCATKIPFIRSAETPGPTDPKPDPRPEEAAAETADRSTTAICGSLDCAFALLLGIEVSAPCCREWLATSVADIRPLPFPSSSDRRC